MKPGRWKDRIAAAKMRALFRRAGSATIPPPRPSRRTEDWNRQWRKRIADARIRGRERAQMYRGLRIYEAGIYIGYRNQETERPKTIPAGRPKLELKLD